MSFSELYMNISLDTLTICMIWALYSLAPCKKSWLLSLHTIGPMCMQTLSAIICLHLCDADAACVSKRNMAALS